jgi:hypothetical protein
VGDGVGLGVGDGVADGLAATLAGATLGSTVVDALGEAAFVHRATGEQVAVADAVEIHVGLAQLGPAVASPDAQLEAALDGLRVHHQRPEEQPAA